MSGYLWRYYLENDAERFQRLLQGSQPNAHTAKPKGPTTPTGSFKSSSFGASGKHRTGPPGTFVITKQMMRELDSMGRSILHLACSEPDRLPFVTALLAHPLSDPGVVDMESGWSAFTRALYHGNVSAAREILAANPSNWSLVKSKDHAGDSPFEVFEASIHEAENSQTVEDNSEDEEESDAELDTNELAIEEHPVGKGDEVFAWGSNKNLTLGFSDGDDRSFPERVHLQRPKELLMKQAKRRYSSRPENAGKPAEGLLDASVLFNPITILDIHLSKFHTAILTTDPYSNLFICGFGRGGRLGFGDEQNVQFTFRPLSPPLLPKKRVERVALGQDHTVVILEGGEVWTWGGNQWGQLGYTLQQKTAKEEPIQSTPRQVFGLIKREPVIGCSASRIHTAVFTEDALYTWGKNDGQLGILDSSDARTLAIQTSPRKVSANFLNGMKIKEVVAIEKATVVLLENHEVWILAGYGYSKLYFPMERFVGLPSGAKNLTRYDTGLNYIRKITGGGDTVCALSQMGDVFAIDVDAILKERSTRGSGKVAWTAQRAWGLRKRHMAVRDVDVGSDGNIIICTQSGSIWRRAKRAKIKESGGEGSRYKFDRVPGLTRITAVRSNTTGAFAAIRKDSDLMRKKLAVDPQGLWEDVSKLLSFGGLFEGDDNKEELGIIDDDESWGYGPRPRPRGYTKALGFFMQENVEYDLREFLLGIEPGNWDMSISTDKCSSLEVPVHSFILSRSPALRKLLAEGSGTITNICYLDRTGEKPRLVLHDMELLTMLNLVYYLYIDTIIDLWHQRATRKSQSDFFKSLRVELSKVASALGLKPLEEAVGRMQYPPRSMDRDFRSAYRDTSFFQTADMVIDVAEGESIVVHSSLMRVRCPFFDALYEGRAKGAWLHARQTQSDLIHVDMKHVPKDIAEMVISWLYQDWDTEGFDGIRVGVEDGDVDQFLDFVLDVLSTANELMLERLCQVCQKVIGRYVTTRNAAGLLMAVAPASEKGFKETCLQYICANLETMLEHHLLDELDADLMVELDDTVRSNQRRAFPLSRGGEGGGKQEAILLTKYPTMKDDSEREKAAAITSYTVLAEESQLSSSMAASSPMQKAKRKNAKVVAPNSPLVKALQGHDEIFSMDDDESLPSLSTSRSPELGPTSSPWKDVKGKAPATFIDPFLSAAPVASPRPAGVPWTTPSSAPKVDMREILAETSAETPGKSVPADQITTPKLTPKQMSQRERKRIQAQQQLVAAPAPSTPDKKAVWNVNPASTPRINLKEVLASSPTRAPTSASPTQRRTVATSHVPGPVPSPSFPKLQPSPARPAQPSFAPSPTPSRPSASAPRKPIEFLPLSMQDIIDQEEAQKELMKEFQSKRSLQEIQEEQEFLRWWESESRKAQGLPDPEEERRRGEERQKEEEARKGKGGRGGKKGGRGRGGGETAPAEANRDKSDAGRGKGRGRGRGSGRGGGAERARGTGRPVGAAV